MNARLQPSPRRDSGLRHAPPRTGGNLRRFPPVLAALALALLTLGAIPPGADAQRVQRVKECAAKEAATVKKIARRTVQHAVKKYRMSDLLTSSDGRRASLEMYNFLKWKMGGTTPACGQYVTAGQGHFNKAYGDEAAALLLGVISFAGRQPEIVVPDWMIEYMRMRIEVISGTAGREFLAKNMGFKQPFILDRLVIQALDELEGKAKERADIFIPKRFDVQDRIVEANLDAAREHRRAQQLARRGEQVRRDRKQRKGRQITSQTIQERGQDVGEEDDRSRIPEDRITRDRRVSPREAAGGGQPMEGRMRALDATTFVPCEDARIDPGRLPDGVTLEGKGIQVRPGYRFVQRSASSVSVVRKGGRGLPGRLDLPQAVGVEGTFKCHCPEGTDDRRGCAIEAHGDEVRCHGQCLDPETQEPQGCDLDVRVTR